MDGSILGQFESWKLSLSQAKDFSLQEVGARASLLHKNLNFLSPSKKFEPMPGLGLTKLELSKWLSGKNLPPLKIQYSDCTLSGQIILPKNLKNITA